MLNKLGLALLVIVTTSELYAATAEPAYPANPNVTPDAIYVTAQGVTRYASDGMRAQWRVLPGLRSFAPVVTEQAIIVGSDQGLYALDPASGKQLWRHMAGSTVFSPVVSGEMLYVTAKDGSLQALSLGDGKQLWQQHFKGGLNPPVLAAGIIIVSDNDGLVHGVGPDGGKPVWQQKLAQGPVHRPLVLPDNSIVITTLDGQVTRLRASDGHILWQLQDPVPSFTPAYAAERLIFGGYDGRIRARALADANLLWAGVTRGKARFVPHIVGDRVMVVSERGQMVMLDLVSGETLWRKTHAGEPVGSPVVINQKIILFLTDGTLSSWPLPAEFSQ